jgi:hypothetical protein
MSTAVPRLTVPLDSDGFVLQFRVEDTVAAQSFFDEYGFVVLSDVLSEEERVRTINDMWSTVEKYCGGKLGIHRDNPASWIKHWPGGGPGLLGQALTPAAWENRANPRLRSCFENIVGKCTPIRGCSCLLPDLMHVWCTLLPPPEVCLRQVGGEAHARRVGALPTHVCAAACCTRANPADTHPPSPHTGRKDLIASVDNYGILRSARRCC